jgi:tol-pal system protein YbgF
MKPPGRRTGGLNSWSLKSSRPGSAPMRKSVLGLVLLLGFLTAASSAVDQKKAYELIYEDVQLIKQQMIKLETKIDKAIEEILLLKDQLKDAQSEIKLSQADQADLKQDINKITPQTQALLDRLEQVTLAVNRLTEDFVALRAQLTQPPVETPKTKPAAKKPEAAKKEETPEEAPHAAAPVNPNLSPKEVFDMAYADYTKGNYELAIDGFKIYRQQFFDSPLADDALYWIGECYFSLGKYDEAITQFNTLIFNYPQGNNLPAAYLKKGMSYAQLGKKDEAISVFKLLINKYPNDEEAKIAQQKIKELTSSDERS